MPCHSFFPHDQTMYKTLILTLLTSSFALSICKMPSFLNTSDTFCQHTVFTCDRQAEPKFHCHWSNMALPEVLLHNPIGLSSYYMYYIQWQSGIWKLKDALIRFLDTIIHLACFFNNTLCRMHFRAVNAPCHYCAFVKQWSKILAVDQSNGNKTKTRNNLFC